jgi:hypothetical protein
MKGGDMKARPMTEAARRAFREALLDLARDRRPDLTWTIDKPKATRRG